MSATFIIGQPRVQDAIAHAASSGRVAQSYLFHGPDGTGKKAAALAFAQTLLCEQKSGHDGLACGKCLPCTKAQRGLHPDIHIYLPHPKDTNVSKISERIQRIFVNPYAQVDFKRRPSLDDAGKTSSGMVIYHAGYIESIQREFYHVPVEGTYSIGILVDADFIQTATANKFLKMLEEPPERTILILTAERTDTMLPTILSRCQHVRFDPLMPIDIEQALIEREHVEAQRASFVARMADGSFTAALELLDNEDIGERRALAIEYIRQSFSKHPDRVMPLIEQISKLGREPVKQLMGLMLSWVRDIVLFQAAGAAASLINVDQSEAIQKFVAGLPDADSASMVSHIEAAAQLIERNSHVGLTLTVLSDALSDSMRGNDRAQLFESLDSPAVVMA